MFQKQNSGNVLPLSIVERVSCCIKMAQMCRKVIAEAVQRCLAKEFESVLQTWLGSFSAEGTHCSGKTVVLRYPPPPHSP